MNVRGDAWSHVRAARLPAAGLAALAAVRTRPGVAVCVEGDVAWVTWEEDGAAVVSCLRAAPGVEFFERRGGRWHRFGCRLPTDEGPPTTGAVPLDRAVTPARIDAVPPPTRVGRPVPLRVARGGAPQHATALRCDDHALARWADAATTAELAAVRAARCGGRALLLGDRLPVVPGGERFWGGRVLVPVGFRPDPPLPEGVIRAACGAETDELLVLDERGAAVIPDRAFAPLTRAGVRLAMK
jgi:hypothetical protein